MLTNYHTAWNISSKKFNFYEKDMSEVPQSLFTYLRQIFKDRAFRSSQYKMLIKLIYS